MDYLRFKNNFGQPILGTHRELFYTIQKYVADEDVKGFYPRNMLLEGRDMEVFIFTEGDIWSFRKMDNIIETSVIKVDKIVKLKLAHSQNEYGMKLEIEFTNGDKLSFKSSEDTNENWKDTFSVYLEGIFKLLNQAP
ncbi:hypothetical protein PMSD_20675 [Paenibacillus macquariensis subsp. defensor]|nr:hypothetical protein PMSD_20675 [Paenibacillus macquariensis subsp. defensor]